ncbi:DUF1697 domain-containing protein [Desulfosporosinus sp. Sb-LF]|uniref:DUF1697 domain-containing protein n=1 Tax=Desulfosporosinus sp. Sb-LF TaxID=2560027 RepID=UPI00107FC551|nr:DUF1697 domain-containing protein [Desulfosporosinus sp. Sb-LF]TGE33126.1 DUF1697 domain-containing protein [Desulfosporosinus sp. Sb-LF]
MVEKLVALVRGINVGRAKRVAMADLCALFEDIGYRNVRTLLNSGNVIFASLDTEAVSVAARIEEALINRIGISARVIVLTAAEIATIVNDNPLAGVADNPSRLLVAVLRNPAERTRLEPLAEQEWGSEVLAIGVRVAYLWCPDGILASQLPEAVGRVLGDGVTTRNWATVMKLYALTEK